MHRVICVMLDVLCTPISIRQTQCLDYAMTCITVHMQCPVALPPKQNKNDRVNGTRHS